MIAEPGEPTRCVGSEWRIHYWKFKARAEAFALAAAEAAKNQQSLVDDDPYAGVYDDVPTELWRERSGIDDDYEEPLF